MSNRLTSVRFRDRKLSDDSGLALWGLKTRAEMIRTYRDYAQRQLEKAQSILDANDSDFIVETYLGPLVERNKKEIHD